MRKMFFHQRANVGQALTNEKSTNSMIYSNIIGDQGKGCVASYELL